MLYVVESSEDIVNWKPVDVLEKGSAPFQWFIDIAPVAADGAVERKHEFFRVKTVEMAPKESSRSETGR